MVNKKISSGVGKKIVEALKKQSEIEITPIPNKKKTNTTNDFDEINNVFDETDTDETEMEDLGDFQESSDFQDDFNNQQNSNLIEEQEEINLEDNSALEDFTVNEQPVQFQTPAQQQVNHQMTRPVQQQSFGNFQQQAQDSFMQDLESFEIPSNVAVLKRLISQLPNGVSKQMGAQIIKQTMEALGISMKSVLQEAQQVQDGLNTSATECRSSISEYKKQIMVLEKQAQSYQRQYSALNELISLFVQTGI